MMSIVTNCLGCLVNESTVTFDHLVLCRPLVTTISTRARVGIANGHTHAPRFPNIEAGPSLSVSVRIGAHHILDT